MSHTNSPTLARSYAKGSRLFEQGEACRGVFIVLRGQVALFTGISPDRKLRIGCFSSGCVLGLPETICGSAYETSAVAVTGVTVHLVPRDEVLRIVRGDSSDGLRIASLVIADLENLHEKIRFLAFYRPKATKHGEHSGVISRGENAVSCSREVR